jgi:hypothetical protein
MTGVAEAAEVMVNTAIPMASLRTRLEHMSLSPCLLFGCAFGLRAKSTCVCKLGCITVHVANITQVVNKQVVNNVHLNFVAQSSTTRLIDLNAAKSSNRRNA